MNRIKSVNGALVFLYAVLANLAVQFVSSAVILIAGGDLGENAVFNFAMMFLIQVGFLTVFYLCVLRPKRELSIGIRNKIRYESLAFAPVLALLCICAFYLLTLWYTLGLEKTGFAAPASVVMEKPFDFVLGCFVFCVAAPIGEELVFRGALLSGLRSKYGAVTSILLSGLAFMLMHMNPSQVVYQFLLGCVCAAAALACGSVLVPILIHACSNALAVIIDYTALGELIERFGEYLIARPAIAVVVTLACFAVFSFAILVCLYFIKKLNAKDPKKEGTLYLEKEPLATKPTTDENGDAAIARHEAAVDALEKKDKLVYCVACGVCLLMWVIALISGYMS